MYGDYNRGGMGFEPEEKHHKGAAFVMALFSIIWIGFYSYWMNTVALDCCVEVNSNGDVVANGICTNSASASGLINVSSEFRMICVVGVSLYVVLLMVALGHCMKPFRRFSHLFGGAIWVALFGFFIASNVFRFRDAGRFCSLESHTGFFNPL